jgi:xylan 1,4-beta-xylosidase
LRGRISKLSSVFTFTEMIQARYSLPVVIVLAATHGCREPQRKADVEIQINLEKKVGPMTPVWAWFGYDEPNYTYMKDGRKLLTEISELSPVPVYVRAHNLLTTGDGTPALKWGSTNAYTEDQNGKPVYDWTLVDSIISTYVDRGMRPLVEIGFMPEALSSKPTPYKHSWKPGAPYNEIYTGWAYPPKDYKKWSELVFRWVQHCVEKYGKEEVERWYWELWNEPNIGYWQGTIEEYCKLYDYTADAVKRALPSATLGGPHSTGPSWDKAELFLRTFLDHVTTGKNYVTGETGTPIDFIGFHAKGAPKLQGDSIILMNMGTQLRDISKGFEIVAGYPSLKDKPIVIGESDPEGCAACSMKDYPSNAYRNGTLYSSYTASVFARKYALADHFGVNFKGAVTWAFEFEDQPWFNGYRDLATNGVDKPVLNVFRMFGMMSGDRVAVSGNMAYDVVMIRDSSVRKEARDINALAAVDGNKATIMVWNYHDLNVITPPAPVDLVVVGLPSDKCTVAHYRIDQVNSNSYEYWRKMGSPQDISAEDYDKLEAAGKLKRLDEQSYNADEGRLVINAEMEGQAVSLFVISWQ